MTNHEPGRESVERCARAITGLRTLDEWTRSQVATEVLRCAVESGRYVDRKEHDDAIDAAVNVLMEERDRLRAVLERIIAGLSAPDYSLDAIHHMEVVKIARDALEGKA